MNDEASVAPEEWMAEIIESLSGMIRLYESKWSDEPDELLRARMALLSTTRAYEI